MRKRTRAKARRAGPTSDAAPPGVGGGELPARPWLAPLVVFAGALALYVATLAPSVMGGDSGELTAAALTGGVPHPPGYPLFAILARLFAALPFGPSPAWRVNLLSAVSTAGAAALVCLLVERWTREAAAGLVAGALLATNAVVWRHAIAAEVFGLNAFFVALAFLLWLSVERAAAERGVRRRVFVLLGVCGLAMCNHHTFVFVGAPLALRSLWVARRQLGPGGVAGALGIGLLGLTPYAYLWFAGRSAAAVSWGDQSTLAGFIAHILRRDYGTFSMGQASKGSAFVEGGVFFATLWRMLGHAFPRFVFIGPLLAALGIYGGVRAARERGLTYVLLLVLGGYVLAFSGLSNLSTARELYIHVLSRFCIQSDLLLAIAAGLGCAGLLGWAKRRFAWAAARARFAPGLAVLVAGAGIAAHAAPSSQRNNRVFADFVTTAFASLPENAIVITMGDHLTGSVFYFREVEKLRPDVIHLDRELLGFTWYGERKRRLHPDLYLPAGVYGRSGWKVKGLLDGNPNRPVVVIDRLETWDETWKDGYKLATMGLVHPLVPAARFPGFDAWLARDRQAMGTYDVLTPLRMPAGSWERLLGELVLTTQAGRAHLSLVYSTDAGHALPPARNSIALLEDIVAKAGGDPSLGIAAHPGVDDRKLAIGSGVYKDLGIGYEILSKVDGAYLPRVAIAFERFIERADASDKDLPAARRYVEQHRARP